MFKAGAVYIKNNLVGTVNVYCKFKNNQGLIGETGSKNKPFILTEEHINSNGFMAGIGFYCAKDSLISNGTMKPMIYQNGDGTWEPFTGGKSSPSPEYPSPIVSVGDKGNIGISIDGTPQQKLVLSTPNGLPGIKVDSGGNYTDSDGQQWVCDEIDLERGKYVQRIYANTFNGSENWYIHPKGNFYLDLKETFNNKLSTGIFSNAVSQEGKTHFGATGVYFEKTEAFPTLSSFKEYLSNEQNKGNPVTAIMTIKTPIENDLNQETIAAYKALHTNNPTTVISNNESADMELTYTVDTKTYVDKKIAEISTAIVQKGI